MKKNRLKLLSILSLSLVASVSWGQTTFNYSGTADTYTVPAGANSIQIEVSGGEGGAGNGGVGGLGATMIGTFSVTPGDVLDVVVGGAGALFNNAGGGAGGSGVIFNSNPMIIAGGGGGGATNGAGSGGLITLDGGNSSGLGGLAGNGGGKGYSAGDCGWAGGGGGFLTDGFGGDGNWDGGTPGVAGTLGGGVSHANGGAGGVSGGCQFQANNGAYGCGGGGAGEYGGSGGGGYSGGGGGQYIDAAGIANYGGAGGGSINNGTDQTNTADNHAGDGVVIITLLCSDSPSAFSVDACEAYTLPSGNNTYMVSGVYIDTIPNATGCDSIMTITVNVISLDLNTTTTDFTITADQASGTYQWINCADNLPIAGETNQSFTADANGDYAVIVTDGSCSDTSACTTIAGVGINELNELGISFYPNPTTGKVTIENTNSINIIAVYSIEGKKLITFNNTNTINISELDAGIYIVKIITGNETVIKQLVKK
jgi:hypothetical protein